MQVLKEQCCVALVHQPYGRMSLLPREKDYLMATKSKSEVGALVTIVVSIVVPICAATWYLGTKFSDLEKHISKVETAVRIVGAKQGGDTKTLIDEALTVAMNDSKNGRGDQAKVVLNITNNLLSEQSHAQAPLTQSDFTNVLVKYQALKSIPLLSQDAHQGMLTLAEYRTATTPVPHEAQSLHIGESGRIGNFIYFKNSVFIGPGALGTGNGQDTDIDGMILENVVFRDANIVYKGGPIRLINVRFINCRFNVPNSPKGDQLLEAAINQDTSLQIG